MTDQKNLTLEFQELLKRPAANGDILAQGGFVWKYVVGAGRGVWRQLCRQVETPGIDYALAEHVPVTLPPDKLIAALLLAHTTTTDAHAIALTKEAMMVLRLAGWTHPDSAAGEPIPGSINVFRESRGGLPLQIFVEDLRPSLAMLEDPGVKTLLVKDINGDYTWIDLQGAQAVLEPERKDDE